MAACIEYEVVMALPPSLTGYSCVFLHTFSSPIPSNPVPTQRLFLPSHTYWSTPLLVPLSPSSLQSHVHFPPSQAPHCASHFLLPQQLTRHLLKVSGSCSNWMKVMAVHPTQGLELVGDKDSVHHLLQSPICLSSFIVSSYHRQ